MPEIKTATGEGKKERVGGAKASPQNHSSDLLKKWKLRRALIVLR